MEAVLDLGVQIVLFFQRLGTWLVVPMQLISMLGNEEFFLLMAPAIYWCVDSKAGLRLGIILMFSGCLNTYIKFLFHQPRPYWIDPAVKAYDAETSFGIPSGHAQNAVAVWGGLAASLKQRWLWYLAGILALLIGLSRIYVGVHFPTDVLAGWLTGGLLLWAFIKLEPGIYARIKNLRPGGQALLAFAVSVALILLGILIRLSLGGWSLPPEWVANAQAATPEAEPIDPINLSGVVSNSAVLFGLCCGAILMSLKGGFKATGKPWQLVLRYIIGAVGIFALWAGLRVIFPAGGDWLAMVFRYIRYGLVGFWVSGGAPWVFIKLKLAGNNNGQNTTAL